MSGINLPRVPDLYPRLAPVPSSAPGTLELQHAESGVGRVSRPRPYSSTAEVNLPNSLSFRQRSKEQDSCRSPAGVSSYNLADVKPTSILCADWGKPATMRSVAIAQLTDDPVVRRVTANEWTLASVLHEAETLASLGPVIVALDVPLGVPLPFLNAAQRLAPCEPPMSFLELLLTTATAPRFFERTEHPEHWTVQRPFFRVPKGEGGLTSYLDAAARFGVSSLLRTIDKKTRAKPVFITAGIPGSVGSSARDIWLALQLLLRKPRSFAVWPFEGDLTELLASQGVVVAETYPRAAYATALFDGSSTTRPPLRILKTDARHRAAAVEMLASKRWIRATGIRLCDLDHARNNGDAFDAYITAAALLRCILEDLPLTQPLDKLRAAEGGILGSGSINPDLPETTLRVSASDRAPQVPCSTVGSLRSPKREFLCPIPGCTKRFHGSRGGWDGHVGSVALHPDWHPELIAPGARRHQFAVEYADFFRG